MSLGPIHFTNPTMVFGLVLDGTTISGQMKPIDWKHGELVAREELQNGTVATQSLWTSPEAPLAIAPYEGSLSFYLLTEGDYEAILDVLAQGQPVPIFFGWWQIDRWWVAAAPGAQTEWKTSRPFAWNLAARASYAPKAWLDTTPQTVVATGTPSAGEVMIPDSGGGTEGTVTTPAASGLGASYLRVKYPALFNAVITASWSYQEVNGLRVDLEVFEAPGGQYS